MLYGIVKSATDVVVAVCSISGFIFACDWHKKSRSLQLLLDLGRMALFSALTLFSTTHSLSQNRSQFCTMPLDSVNFSVDFSIVVDDDEVLLSLNTTRFEFSIDISEVFKWFWTCSYWFITDFSTTILWDISTTLWTFSESVTWTMNWMKC